MLSVLLASVAVASLRGTPRPGWTGTHLGVTIALLGCVLPMAAARGSQTLVTLRFEEKATVLTVEDRVTQAGAAPEPAMVSGVSGMGLTGMRERLAEVGGCATAGPTLQGWIVRMEVPA